MFIVCCGILSTLLLGNCIAGTTHVPQLEEEGREESEESEEEDQKAA